MTMVLALALMAAQASSTTARELTRFEARLAETWKKGDCAAYGAMLAPEWSVIHVTGEVLTRAQVLDLCKAASVPIASFEIADLHVRIYGTTAVVTGRTTVITGGATPATVRLRFTDVFVRSSGAWKVVASQATQLGARGEQGEGRTDQQGEGENGRRNSVGRKAGPLDEQALFIQFWIKESTTTRKVLARIPEGSEYRPDPKSRTAKDIAWQIVCEEKMIIDAMESGKAEWAPPAMPASMKEVLDAYDRQSARMSDRWTRLSRARWDGPLEFFGESRPASAMAWSFLFDIVHHRGQITTYLRPMGSTVPQIYGPSGDEP
jgi:uncharacterized damage-inducible protein DinB